MRLPTKLFRNFPIPAGSLESNFAWMVDEASAPLFLVSYPKCGSTWLQHVLFLLHSGGRPPTSMGEVVEAVPFPEQDGVPPLERRKTVLALKSHLPLTLTPLREESKYIYIARNPKDSCISYYHFLKRLPGYQIENLDFFFQDFLSGSLPYGCAADHAVLWEAASRSHPHQVLFLTYEGMSENPRGVVKRMADFLGFNDLKPEVVDAVVSYSSFSFMRALSQKDTFMKEYLKNSTGKLGDGKDAEPRMLRKGEVGDWRNHLTPQQSDEATELYRKKLTGSKLWNIWEKYL